MAKTKKSADQKQKTSIEPLGDRVLVKPFIEDVFEKRTDSGIIIPETVDKEKPEQGEVMAVGEGRYDDGKLIPVKVKVGQKVIFSKYGYDEVKVKDEELYILKEENILAVIK